MYSQVEIRMVYLTKKKNIFQTKPACNNIIEASSQCKSSVKLTEYLKKQGNGIPVRFLPNRDCLVGSLSFDFIKRLTLVLYISKKSILLPSMYYGKTIDNVKNYINNSTKGGVDVYNDICSVHLSSPRTQRWSMAILFKLLDISGMNA